MTADILIIDDEQDICMLLEGVLNDEGYSTRVAHNDADALQMVDTKEPDLLILDIWLEGSARDGLDVLKEVKAQHPNVPVIMISGHGNIETAVSAIKEGAYDFIEKPFKSDRLLLLVSRALEAANLRKENQELKIKAGTGAVMHLIGQSLPIRQLQSIIDKVAPTDSRVLITGDAGTGKEVVARLLHQQSRRKDNPYMVLNCAMMRPDRLEIELFGAEPGVAGQPSGKSGVLEQAHGGTLLLDEVADMPLETQGKIVRVLQDQQFERVGGTQRIEVDVRIVASTNRDLNALMEAGDFRQDLFYRLSVVPIHMPSLSQRREDIPDLAMYFMQTASANIGLQPRRFTDDAIAALQAYAWPGNVRQLRNVIEWLLIMAGGPVDEPIPADMLPAEISAESPASAHLEKGAELMALPLREAREVFEREYLWAQVNRFGGNISKTAAFIGMERSALHRKLKALGIQGTEKVEQVSE